MLVVTPTGPSLADRKPRVISEIRKANVQRSPSLDGHPKLSGILNYYCDDLGIWSQRTVAVRDGCLLVYGPDCSPYDFTPARSYASLGRNATPHRIPLHSAYSELKALATPLKSSPNPTYATPDLRCYANKNGCNSLGRSRNGIYSCGDDEFRLPLRNLNLMPSSLAPRAFCLSYRQNGNGAVPVAVFQALSQLEYERWVKTLAVEIMKQTPLDAIRFLDVLGIAALSTPTANADGKKPNDTKRDPKSPVAKKKSSHETASRWDRSPSSEGSTTSADFITTTSKKKSAIGQTTFTRRKLHMSDVESLSDKDEVDCLPEKTSIDVKTSSGRKSREKMRRSRDGFDKGSSSEDTRAPDEGIVIEERGSSSDRSCRRALWSSDRSDILDSPRSISSYSSYECDSPESADVPDGVVSNKKFVPIVQNIDFEGKPVDIVPSNEEVSRSSPMILCRAQPFINEPSPEPECPSKKVDFNESKIPERPKTLTPVIIVSATKPWDLDYLKGVKPWNRARSCSPNNARSPSRFGDGRYARALSVGQSYLSVPDAEMEESVEALRQRCQNSENYVPVREKLALFESLCRAGRLARSSEELAAGVEKSSCSAPRARSLHDLTRSRSPQVPVKEMCKFFEKIGCNDKANSKTKKTSEHVPLYEKHNSKCCNRDKYLKHKRNDCSNINKDSAFDKMVHRQGGIYARSIAKDKLNNQEQSSIKDKPSEDEMLKYANFTQIREGNKIITYI